MIKRIIHLLFFDPVCVCCSWAASQAWKGDGKGGTDIGFGASVYPAAYVLAEYLERHPYLIEGKRVIELGESFP